MMSPSVLLWPLIPWLIATEFQLTLWQRLLRPAASGGMPDPGDGAAVVLPFKRVPGAGMEAETVSPGPHGVMAGELILFPTFRPAG